MKERPILMSAPMVRACLNGSKTQTRRAVKWPKVRSIMDDKWYPADPDDCQVLDGRPIYLCGPDAAAFQDVPCPYGQPGDRLWVRENGWERPERTPKMMREGADTWKPYYFDADGLSDQESAEFKAWGFKRRPSIHMPRWACRLELEIIGVRVERLQEISEADADAEGCERLDSEREEHDYKICRRCGGTRLYDHHSLSGSTFDTDCQKCDTYAKRYRYLWEAINGDGAWDANPWVWVVEFKRAKP